MWHSLKIRITISNNSCLLKITRDSFFFTKLVGWFGFIAYRPSSSSSSSWALSAWISLTLSLHPSLWSFAFGRSSGLHPVSTQSCCMYVRVGRSAFTRPFKGVHSSTSLMSSSLLLQQCPTCLFRLTLIVFVMGGRWPYSCCFVGCCLQDVVNIACSILM